MNNLIDKRRFLAAGIGAGVGLGAVGARAALLQATAVQPAPAAASAVPVRKATTKNLFKAPDGFPNALAGSPEGLWVGEQKLSGRAAEQYGVTPPKDLSEKAWLLDWKTGKVKKTVVTQSRNTSGMAFGGGYIWMCANASPNGVFQTDMNSNLVSHRQIPLGPADNGGGCHGAKYYEGKLWIVSTRMHGVLRVDPQTWQPDYFIPGPPQRTHDIAFDGKGGMWIVTGNRSSSYSEGQFGLAKYEVATGRLIETIEFEPGSGDPHGLEYHDGVLYSCDAGIHPGWPNRDSPSAGYIFRIDIA